MENGECVVVDMPNCMGETPFVGFLFRRTKVKREKFFVDENACFQFVFGSSFGVFFVLLFLFLHLLHHLAFTLAFQLRLLFVFTVGSIGGSADKVISQ
ncbi:MAG TPA: hypothetical protein PKE63_01895 [Lacibacter sp.]|nr:hypothetical protein [Lacibacter sp.]HMO89897.1 hypothetical protein [Lacibacter sp.]HMP85996.1 hypothetical protein [Lacibacter sp.]